MLVIETSMIEHEQEHEHDYEANRLRHAIHLACFS